MKNKKNISAFIVGFLLSFLASFFITTSSAHKGVELGNQYEIGSVTIEESFEDNVGIIDVSEKKIKIKVNGIQLNLKIDFVVSNTYYCTDVFNEACRVRFINQGEYCKLEITYIDARYVIMFKDTRVIK